MENQPNEIEQALRQLEQAAADREAAAAAEQQRAAEAAQAEQQAAEWQEAERLRRAADPAYDVEQKIHTATEVGRRASIAQLDIISEINARVSRGEIEKEAGEKLRSQVDTMSASDIVHAHATKAHVTTLNALAYEHAQKTGRSFAPSIPTDPASLGLNAPGATGANTATWEKLGLSAASIEKLKREFADTNGQ